MFRTAGYAIPASRALYKMLTAIHAAHRIYGNSFDVGKRLKLLHKRQIIAHLNDVAHSGQHHKHALEPRGESYRIACGAASAEILQNFICAAGQIYKTAALYRLHYDNRLIVLAAHVVTPPRLYFRVVVIDIIKLELHKFHFGMLA